MKKYLLNIRIVKNEVVLTVQDNDKTTKTEFKRLKWNDRRDLSEKLLRKIDLLLKKNDLVINDISKVGFSGKGYGFMAGQVGRITAKVLNFGMNV